MTTKSEVIFVVSCAKGKILNKILIYTHSYYREVTYGNQ
jgi:hypothetical protein